MHNAMHNVMHTMSCTQRMSSAKRHARTHVNLFEIEAQQWTLRIIKKENSNGRCAASARSRLLVTQHPPKDLGHDGILIKLN